MDQQDKQHSMDMVEKFVAVIQASRESNGVMPKHAISALMTTLGFVMGQSSRSPDNEELFLAGLPGQLRDAAESYRKIREGTHMPAIKPGSKYFEIGDLRPIVTN